MSKFSLGILIFSIALNFALIGYLAGRAQSPPPFFDPTRAFVSWSENLRPERSRALRSVMRAHAPEHRQHLRSLRQHNHALVRALDAQVLQPDKLAETLQEMRAAHVEAQSRSHDAFLTFVGSLTLQERRQLAARLRNHRSGPPARRSRPPGLPADRLPPSTQE